jgi:hypothetical protein
MKQAITFISLWIGIRINMKVVSMTASHIVAAAFKKGKEEAAVAALIGAEAKMTDNIKIKGIDPSLTNKLREQTVS